MFKNHLKRIEKLYLDGKLFEDTDEKYAGGYWDLAGEIADELLAGQGNEKIAGYTGFELYEQLQEGFYQVFQRVLVRGEKHEKK